LLLNPETGVPFASRVILSHRVIEFCNRAGVEGSAHCFRDTFACDMLTRGIGVYEVAKMLADTVETVEEYYA
jgi:integrase